MEKYRWTPSGMDDSPSGEWVTARSAECEIRDLELEVERLKSKIRSMEGRTYDAYISTKAEQEEGE